MQELDALFWVALTVFGSGLVLVGAQHQNRWGILLSVVGACGLVYDQREALAPWALGEPGAHGLPWRFVLGVLILGPALGLAARWATREGPPIQSQPAVGMTGGELDVSSALVTKTHVHTLTSRRGPGMQYAAAYEVAVLRVRSELDAASIVATVEFTDADNKVLTLKGRWGGNAAAGVQALSFAKAESHDVDLAVYEKQSGLWYALDNTSPFYAPFRPGFELKPSVVVHVALEGAVGWKALLNLRRWVDGSPRVRHLTASPKGGHAS